MSQVNLVKSCLSTWSLKHGKLFARTTPEAMKKELQAFKALNTYNPVHYSKVPKGVEKLSSDWVFARKFKKRLHTFLKKRCEDTFLSAFLGLWLCKRQEGSYGG